MEKHQVSLEAAEDAILTCPNLDAKTIARINEQTYQSSDIWLGIQK